MKKIYLILSILLISHTAGAAAGAGHDDRKPKFVRRIQDNEGFLPMLSSNPTSQDLRDEGRLFRAIYGLSLFSDKEPPKDAPYVPYEDPVKRKCQASVIDLLVRDTYDVTMPNMDLFGYGAFEVRNSIVLIFKRLTALLSDFHGAGAARYDEAASLFLARYGSTDLKVPPLGANTLKLWAYLYMMHIGTPKYRDILPLPPIVGGEAKSKGFTVLLYQNYQDHPPHVEKAIDKGVLAIYKALLAAAGTERPTEPSRASTFKIYENPCYAYECPRHTQVPYDVYVARRADYLRKIGYLHAMEALARPGVSPAEVSAAVRQDQEELTVFNKAIAGRGADSTLMAETLNKAAVKFVAVRSGDGMFRVGDVMTRDEVAAWTNATPAQRQAAAEAHAGAGGGPARAGAGGVGGIDFTLVGQVLAKLFRA